MMLGLRQKLTLGFGGLLVILVIVGAQSIAALSRLGQSIDVILRENYRSVIACQEMKEALERIDSGVLFTLLGDSPQGEALILKNKGAFEAGLQVELNTITLAGEGEKARLLRDDYGRYAAALDRVKDATAPPEVRRDAYFRTLLPLFGRIKATADAILQMNQQNMNDANNRARQDARAARRQMYLLLGLGTLIALALVVFSRRWILRPVRSLIKSADEIRRGNLDLVVPVGSRDEIGHLAESFNAMAASLRELRRSDQARLARVRRATEQAFDRLADPIAVLDLDGRVEVSTESAREVFGLRPGASVRDLPPDIDGLFGRALAEGRPVPPRAQQKLIQQFVGGEERFYRPEAVPILDAGRQPTGVILVLQDVTQLRQQDEIKRNVIRTVSHQLKTPLTSVRLAIHLLLEEKIGPLNEKQAELLIAAREDSERLHIILNNLLDISRLEAGQARLDLETVSPRALILDSLEPFRRAAQDQGVTLAADIPGDLAGVRVDRSRLGFVFGNIITNALQHTPPGGKITVSAEEEGGEVRISISDTGGGIPEAFLPKVFEPFFRVPGRKESQGAGLGLAIAKEIVEAHGGQVGVESREGQGATFFFTLKKAGGTGAEEPHHE
ncbi:MAG TPA: ATP-binding protein [Candidatus Aminicenantes bacterium]|nr:ATP-binding protein [Candidatus Aminicenantes bacterium]HRY64941.1 ATP-binding protein [Candidatus Aminicenantes bacterium]HRZ71854.1 ATP-binding protein [Candidatus Aminicenantes bacterium]